MQRTAVIVVGALVGLVGPASATVASNSTSPDSSIPGTTGPDSTFPGGVDSGGVLDDGWFDDQGRLQTPLATTQSTEEDAAICEFMFGSPGEVAAAFGVDELTLMEESGMRHLGGNGSSVDCGYLAAGAAPTTTAVTAAATASSEADDEEDEDDAVEPTVYLSVHINPDERSLEEVRAATSTTATTTSSEESDGSIIQQFVLDDDRIGTVYYGTTFVGTALPTDGAVAWLESASSRFVSGGI